MASKRYKPHTSFIVEITTYTCVSDRSFSLNLFLLDVHRCPKDIVQYINYWHVHIVPKNLLKHVLIVYISIVFSFSLIVVNCF